tara:strand:- start:42639 stop:43040 length:402 start_codon:yes stop_codon:yes gene_type:complete
MFDQYRQFYEQKSDPSLATIFMSDRIAKQESIIFIAKDSAGFGLGFCQLYPSFCSVEAAPIYVLYDLFVRPEYRRNGVARELLLEAEAHATLNQIGRMDLTTAKSNTQAQALYESLGWIRDEVFLTYNRRPNS